MFKHYLTTALRHFSQHKLTTIINVLCLALGLVSFAMAYGWMRNTTHADTYHPKASRTFVVTQRSEFISASSAINTSPVTGTGLAALLKVDFPQLETIARAVIGGEVAVAAGAQKGFANVMYADAEFLQIFDLTFVSGDVRAALQTPRSAVISVALAKQLFGRTDVVGESLLLANRETVHITGVVGSQRAPSHISTDSTAAVQFSLLLSIDTGQSLMPALNLETAGPMQTIFGRNTFTYVVFPESGVLSPDQVRRELAGFANRYVPSDFGRATFNIRPASEIYATALNALVRTDSTGIPGSAILMLLGSLVLLVSILNYANLASAQASTRLKEIALRRVVGARRVQIAGQAFSEALLIASVSALLAVVLLRVFSQLTSGVGLADIGPALFDSYAIWLVLIIGVVVTALLASSYPAWVAARIQPGNALQSGRMPFTKRRLIRALVISQFAASSFLFIATGVMSAQNERVKIDVSNFGADPIVTIENNLRDAGVDVQTLQNELRIQRGIKGVSATNSPLGRFQGAPWIVRASADPTSRSWIVMTPLVDYDFFSTMGIKLLAGRDFDAKVASDHSTGRYGNAVIDRALAADYGWRNPQDAIGKQIFFPSGSAKDAPGIPSTVIGVTENAALYPITTLGNASTAFLVDPTRMSSVVLRLSKQDVSGGLSSIDSVWNRLAPNTPMKRKFLDEQFEATYKQMTAITLSFRALALMALFIGAIGLVGIAAHAIAQRTFEIGVRRTLGASARQIFTMLLRDFSKPILIANLIAWPFAFIAAKGYSSFFADKAPLSALPFVGSLLLGLVIAWLAVTKQASRAARMNPASVLRHE